MVNESIKEVVILNQCLIDLAEVIWNEELSAQYGQLFGFALLFIFMAYFHGLASMFKQQKSISLGLHLDAYLILD
ncbi:hypothetical protein QF117_01855 [Vibrio sp. YMD68]|uniref:hypothetical protein n=1 Tax=Vibrio sp. YMD68 TaxID=3042300 RepID=UPI00249A82E4|nr:hypothetical protein [Vibrio sp. YMD68]WGV98734.1 hypothetical protein QF117_01855 [Vibrio sp. YMD68]